IIGLTYGLLAVGLVLIYRSNRIINFAHGEIGAFAAAVLGLAVTKWHVPYYAALAIALGLGGVVGAVAEVAVVRRLRNAPRLMSVVATLGVGQFLIVFGGLVNAQTAAGFKYPSPPGIPEFRLGAVLLTRPYVAMLVFAPLLVVSLAAFLRLTRYGVALLSAADNPEAARMAGIFASRMSALAWGLAGAVSAFTAILVLPSRGLTSGATFGHGLLLRALTGAVIARMSSLPRALVAGVGLGVLEQLLLWSYPRGGFVEVVLFLVILGALFLQRQQAGRDEEKGSWAAVQAWRPIPEALRRVWLVRNLGRVIGLTLLVVALLLPIVASDSASSTLTSIMAFSIVGLSVGVITGLGRQRPLDTGRSYCSFGLALLVLMVVVAANVRRSGFGRLLVAIRDNEDNARAFTVRASAVKVQGFLLAGFLAGIGGALFGHLLSRVGYQSFLIGSSIDVVAMSVIGGISLLAGPLIGAFYILGIPVFVHADQAALAAS